MEGRHPGERIIHDKLDLNNDPKTRRNYMTIDDHMHPDQAVFHTTCVTLLPVVTVGEDGRPWVSILAPEDGLAVKAGGRRFIESPRHTVLTVTSKIWPGDPLLDTMKSHKWDPEDGSSLEDENNDGMLIAGLGVEFGTRRRHKFAGRVTNLKRSEDNHVEFEVFVNEALGNCPQYLTIRSFDAYPDNKPRIKSQNKSMSREERLPDEVISMIKSADSLFMGTAYTAKAIDRSRFPSHLGLNHRGGRPGWIRVKPSDGKTVYVPDFAGNRIMSSLGNIEATPFASLAFLNWENGDILYVTGRAKNLIGAEAQKVMPMHKFAITEVEVTGYIYVQDALTVRQTPGTKPEFSPYNPPIQLLAEERGVDVTRLRQGEEIKASLASIDIHGKTIATFTWEAAQEIDIKPGQAIILDLNSVLGDARYEYLSPEKESSVNDPRLRTWTVSSAHDGPTKRFRTTLRWEEGGRVTTMLFKIAHKLKDEKPESLSDVMKELQLDVQVVGTSGAFALPTEEVGVEKKLLWIAGGVGFTPFVSMLEGLSQRSSGATYDVLFLLSTREPEVLIPILSAIQAKARTKGTVKLTLVVFSREAVGVDGLVYDTFENRRGRLTSGFFAESPLMADVKEREGYLCGPMEFEQTVVDGLDRVGVATANIHRESFLY
ncbi:hypothetical protein V5O48_008862 [Marasmius crinis-equi]|uniref:FAD-binding FR-type domain-containing protein n=1 Tax=Marasmius crinis-equi TaxID=585013 RepID=A0ABR3FDB9_9AGAR